MCYCPQTIIIQISCKPCALINCPKLIYLIFCTKVQQLATSQQKANEICFYILHCQFLSYNTWIIAVTNTKMPLFRTVWPHQTTTNSQVKYYKLPWKSQAAADDEQRVYLYSLFKLPGWWRHTYIVYDLNIYEPMSSYPFTNS